MLPTRSQGTGIGKQTPAVRLDFGHLTSQDAAMNKFSVYDARARFSELIERAQSGRSTTITKRGHVVARLVPAKESTWDRSAVLDEAEALRKKLNIKRRFNIRELMTAGGL
jgi:prevent-host-death family protein